MARTKKIKPTYQSVEEFYGPEHAPEPEGQTVDQFYAGFNPWKQRMGEVVAEAERIKTDKGAMREFVNEKWRDFARTWATANFANSQMVRDFNNPDPDQRGVAEKIAQVKLFDDMDSKSLFKATQAFHHEFVEEGAWHLAMKKFLVSRQRAGFGFSQQYRQKNPDADEAEVEQATMAELRKFGYHDDRYTLPPISFAPGEEDSLWWQATKETVKGLPLGAYRGTLDLIASGYSLGLAAGEAFTDFDDEPHGEALIPPGGYVGTRRGIAVPVKKGESNVYRLLRMTHAKTMDDLAPMPNAETFVGKLASGVGQAVPQLALLAQGALATRGLALAGATTRAAAMRAATMGTMFALEGSSAFNQYMEYAKQQGLAPEKVSTSALLGALAYASAAAVLERVGPFNALERQMPGVKRRLVAMGLMGATEGGTEFLQSMTQEAIAYGLDFRDVTWGNLADSIQQAAMEGSVGVLAGGAIGGVTFRPQTTGDIDADLEVADPMNLMEVANDIVVKADATQGAPQVEEAAAEIRLEGVLGSFANTLNTAMEVAGRPKFQTAHGELLGKIETAVAQVDVESLQTLLPKLQEALGTKETVAEPEPVPEQAIHPDETEAEVQARTQRELAAQQIEKDAIIAENDEALRMAEDLTPLNISENSVDHPLARLLADQTGAVESEVFLEMLTRPLKSATEMVSEGGDVAASVSHLGFDTSRPLRSTPGGQAAVHFMDQVHLQGKFDAAQALRSWHETWRGIPFTRRQSVMNWMRDYRDDGQTNWATLVEHPERFEGKTLPEGVLALRRAYETGFRHTGRAAQVAGVPQRIFTRNAETGEVDVTARIFQPSEKIRYQRRLTPEGRAILQLQEGHPGWEALVDWLKAHPDRNPNLPTNATELKETLRRITESAKTKRVGALEYIRLFEELPIALKVNGKWLDIQQRDPMAHHETNMMRESQRAAMYRVANKMFQHFGKDFQIGSLGTIDLDKAIDRVRREVGNAAGAAGKNASRHVALFDAALKALEHSDQASMMRDLFGDSHTKSRLWGWLSLPINVAWANAISLSSIWDLGNAAKTIGIVNWGGWLKGEASAWKDIIRNPRKFGAEYETLGAFSDSYHDWTYHRDNIVDLLSANITNIGGLILRASERVSQFRIARIADKWIQGLNRQAGISSEQEDILRRHMRMTDEQIDEIRRGEISDRTRANAIRVLVDVVAAFGEAPHRKGALQRNRTLRWLIRGTQVPAATLRQGLNMAGDFRDGFRAYKEANTAEERKAGMKQFAKAFMRTGSFVVTVAGFMGLGNMMLRRLIKRQPVFQPDDPESWWAWSALLLAEGGMFGPLGQLLDAAEYSEPDLRTYAYHAMFPVAVGLDMITFIGSVIHPEADWARDHPTTPFWTRFRRDFIRYAPAYKALERWLTAMDAPSRDTFFQVRRWGKEWQQKAGLPFKGLSRLEARRKRIFQYHEVWEAIRDGNDSRLNEALTGYIDYAKRQGWEEDDARKRIDQSLAAKQPVLLNKENKEKFLAALPPDRRGIVQNELVRYELARQEVRRRLEELYGTQ